MKRSPKLSGVLFAVIFIIVVLIYSAQVSGTGNTAAGLSQQTAETIAPSQTTGSEAALSSSTAAPTQTPTPEPVRLTADKPEATPPDPQPAVQPTVETALSDDSTIVYITESGSKYHRSGCQYLSHSNIPISLDEAKEQGYTPCSKCDPPE